MVEVVAINLTRRLVHMSDDRTLPITSLIDAFGDDTDEPEDAVVLVCGEPGAFFVVRIGDYQGETVH